MSPQPYARLVEPWASWPTIGGWAPDIHRCVCELLNVKLFRFIQMALFTSISVFLALITVVNTDFSTRGSTRNLRDIVVGRCQDFKNKDPALKHKNCTAIWKKFHEVFAFKDACGLQPADYEPFFDALGEGNVFNKAMFWSGTYRTAHSYSYFDLKFTTLEDTFAGSMMNELHWCGNTSLPPTSDGIDYHSCPSCVKYNTSFWIQASKRFAERVRGQVRVMLNGTRGKDPAYRNDSIFGKYELPSLKVSEISKLIVIVIHTVGKQPTEKCGTKSVKQLKIDAEARGLKVHCENDPDMARHVLCIDHPKAAECQFLYEEPEPEKYWRVLAIVFSVLFAVVFLVVIVLVVLYFCRKRTSSPSSP